MLYKTAQNRFGLYVLLALLFFLWPFFGLCIALLTVQIKDFKYYVVPFFFLLGYSITFKLTEADSYSYGVQFLEIRELSFIDFFKSSYLKGETTDLYKTFLYAILSCFTKSPKFLFGVVALVYGYLFIKCVEFFIGNTKKEFIHYYMLLVFTLVIPFVNLNGFRFWTASFYFVYALFLFSKKKDSKYLLLVASTVFIHFSFVLPVIFILVFYFVGKKPKIYLVFFIITLLINNFISVFIDIGSSFLSNIFLDKLNNYTISNYASSVIEGKGEVSKVFLILNNYQIWYMFITVFITRLNFLRYEFNEEINNLFCILILMFSFINIFGDLPSMHRFNSIVMLLTLNYMMRVFTLNRTTLMKNLNYLALPTILVSTYQAFDLSVDLFSSEIVTGTLFSILTEKSYLIY
ncbi:EpsG family protein [Lutibacter oricola]|uniref:EpsG family protein n=1 Tax=Lutibacter oricola TaxID=762486 RepID=A0A1H3FPM6_9FLAO|nr:EpsG family protein [Lutibacter oricola]SDX92946.1 EpsG family protein [Lutibacter oricola]